MHAQILGAAYDAYLSCVRVYKGRHITRQIAQDKIPPNGLKGAKPVTAKEATASGFI
ncbi:hypothetical protein NVIE_009710 [Nitrososphaera viennensis EN76]|uniref:Uncharacterized protein n=1 Tax=Nitrososphaera viennensis EN76 TaxID=926571 RepID=A0A060HEV0_9ARCH|nr:hypothetical protein NVIE_009710 [Nitrososphaera viennensis EN76]